MCDHTLWDEPTGLCCVETGEHATHSYIATAGPDLANEVGDDW